jgi:hypothetical protein
MNISEAIRHFRTNGGIFVSQEELGLAIGITSKGSAQNKIARFERGETKPTHAEMKLILKHLRVSEDDFGGFLNQKQTTLLRKNFFGEIGLFDDLPELSDLLIFYQKGCKINSKTLKVSTLHEIKNEIEKLIVQFSGDHEAGTEQTEQAG